MGLGAEEKEGGFGSNWKFCARKGSSKIVCSHQRFLFRVRKQQWEWYKSKA